MRKNKRTAGLLLIFSLVLFISGILIYHKPSLRQGRISTDITGMVGSNVFNRNSGTAREVPVLMYHHLLKEEENPFGDNGAILSVDKFEEQMDLLYENGYKTITLEELEGFVKGEIDLPEKSILISFDDGYKSNYEYAYPILKRYGFKATIFLISSWNTDELVTFNPNELQYLSWEEIENSRDVFQYGSHTHNLHSLNDNGLGYLVAQPREEVKNDLKTSMEKIDTVYFAYPYGHYNQESLEILEELGYRMAFTIEPGRVRPGDPLLELPRHSIFPYTSLRDFKSMVGLK